MKSWTFSLSLNDCISGIAVTTLGFPPYYSSLAMASPKDLDTERRPGRTLTGPVLGYPRSVMFDITWLF